MNGQKQSVNPTQATVPVSGKKPISKHLQSMLENLRSGPGNPRKSSAKASRAEERNLGFKKGNLKLIAASKCEIRSNPRSEWLS